MEQATCKQRWAAHKNGRINDLRKLWKAYQSGNEDTDEGSIFEYGLSFEYHVGDGRHRGYWFYLLGCGGPSDDFRFYADGPRQTQPDRITYAFVDWFDGYERATTGKDEALLRELWDWFQESGSVESAYNDAF